VPGKHESLFSHHINWFHLRTPVSGKRFETINVIEGEKTKNAVTFSLINVSSLSRYLFVFAHVKIFIRNMVCIRCQMVVKAELEKLGVGYVDVKIGEVNTIEEIPREKLDQLDIALKKSGLLLMDDKKSILVEKIKGAVIELVHYTEEQIKTNLSDYLSEKLNYDYTYLANLFSEVKGITIEKFYLTHKIEKVKELIVYDELSLSEIAYKLHYSSVSHLSNQFKKITGLSPSHFKKLKNKRRRTLEDV
jgi:AraC-like DNA-binding protein